MEPIDIRLRSRIHPQEMEAKVGKILAPSDVNLVLVNDARVYTPTGDLLCIYRRGLIPQEMLDEVYPTLHSIKIKSNNRGLASGAQRVKVRGYSYANPVYSSVIGSMEESGGRFPMCRTTAWTGEHTKQFEAMYPYFQHIAKVFQENVPDRYAVQQRYADASRPEWVIPGTPYSTVTVNNTYPTGVHKDQGDLQEGFSCLSVLRRGDYEGGWLSFPEYRVSVDMQEGDIIMMDAHQWHGNTKMLTHSEDAERISVVLYFRTEIAKCGSPAEEMEKAKRKVGLK